ncbi:MAG: hypothetical protein ACR2ON_03345 [Paracoccaceae bacterium]
MSSDEEFEANRAWRCVAQFCQDNEITQLRNEITRLTNAVKSTATNLVICERCGKECGNSFWDVFAVYEPSISQFVHNTFFFHSHERHIDHTVTTKCADCFNDTRAKERRPGKFVYINFQCDPSVKLSEFMSCREFPQYEDMPLRPTFYWCNGKKVSFYERPFCIWEDDGEEVFLCDGKELCTVVLDFEERESIYCSRYENAGV